MMSAYNKEIWRAIRKEKKRFFSILLITILGVGMLTGLQGCLHGSALFGRSVF